MENYITCTICDCEMDRTFDGAIVSNIVYCIKNGTFSSAKEWICEHVDYGMVQFYTGSAFALCDGTIISGGTCDDTKWGCFSLKTGEIIVSPEYDYAAPFYGERALVKKNGKYGYIDYNGNVIIDLIWDEIHSGREYYFMSNDPTVFDINLYLVRKDSKWGFIDYKGEVVISIIFNYASAFMYNRAQVKINNKWGYINVSGELVIKAKYDEAYRFQLIGKDKHKQYYAAIIKKDDKYGFIDETGKYIINPILEEVFKFWDIGYACVKDCNKWGIINKSGEFIIPCCLEDIGEMYGCVGKDVYYANRRRIGNLQQTLGSRSIDDTYFTIKLDGKWGVMDSKFNIIMPDINNRFVEFKGKKIYIKNGDVTSIRKINPKD